MKSRFSDVYGSAHKRTFIIGLGGGCDIFAAYALAQILHDASQTFLYGNAKTGSLGPVTPRTPHIVSLAAATSHVGHSKLERCIPAGPDGSPWLVRLDEPEDDAGIAEELQQQVLNSIIGVDLGGDSLEPIRAQRRLGRDQRMMRIIWETGIGGLYVVLAPGCDGQTPTDTMWRYLARWEPHLVGVEPITAFLPYWEAFVPLMGPNRTPMIIRRALAGELTPNADGTYVQVPRGCQPFVPLAWLQSVYVYRGTPA